MCLALPGQVCEWIDRDPLLARAVVDFGGVTREIHMACALNAQVGDYVMVHAGIAIGIVDTEEAEATIADFAQLGEALDGDST